MLRCCNGDIAADRRRRIPLPTTWKDGVGLVCQERRDLPGVAWRRDDLFELVPFGDFVVEEPGPPAGELSQIRPVRAHRVRRQGCLRERLR
jgi:hypothetical protein